MPRAVLGIFAKVPSSGTVKTRLGLPPDHAAAVARAFLLDILERTRTVDAQRIIVFSPTEAYTQMADLVGSHEVLEPQADGDLGQRMERFIDQHLDAAGRILILGSDSPTLPVELITQALDELNRVDIVLGPATDGGYYLVGCRRRLPIFDRIAWSGSTVLAETVALLDQAKGSLSLLPPWYDVDTPESFSMLRGHILAMRLAGIDPGVPCTEALLVGYSPHTSSSTSSAT